MHVTTTCRSVRNREFSAANHEFVISQKAGGTWEDQPCASRCVQRCVRTAPKQAARTLRITVYGSGSGDVSWIRASEPGGRNYPSRRSRSARCGSGELRCDPSVRGPLQRQLQLCTDAWSRAHGHGEWLYVGSERSRTRARLRRARASSRVEVTEQAHRSRRAAPRPERRQSRRCVRAFQSSIEAASSRLATQEGARNRFLFRPGEPVESQMQTGIGRSCGHSSVRSWQQ